MTDNFFNSVLECLVPVTKLPDQKELFLELKDKNKVLEKTLKEEAKKAEEAKAAEKGEQQEARRTHQKVYSRIFEFSLKQDRTDQEQNECIFRRRS